MQLVIHHADAVEIHLLFFPVDGADAVGALEHDMLEVMGHAGGIQGIVLAASMDIHGAVDLRLVMVLAQHDLQAVVEVVSLGLKPCLGGNDAAEQQGNEEENFFHSCSVVQLASLRNSSGVIPNNFIFLITCGNSLLMNSFFISLSTNSLAFSATK